MKRPIFAALSGAWMMVSLAAQAELTVQVTLSVESGIPIAIAPFSGPQSGDNIGSIVAADLARSGRFKVLPVSQMPEKPASPAEIHFDAWKTSGQDNLVIGQINQDGAGRLAAQFQLFDTVRAAQQVAGALAA